MRSQEEPGRARNLVHQAEANRRDRCVFANSSQLTNQACFKISRAHLKDDLVTWQGAPKLIPNASKSIPGAPNSFQRLPSQESTWRGLYRVILKMRPEIRGTGGGTYFSLLGT